MKRIKDLKPSDFPGIDPEKVQICKKMTMKVNILTLVGNLLTLVLLVYFGLHYGGVGAIGVLVGSRIIIYALNRPLNRTINESGITSEMIKNACED